MSWLRELDQSERWTMLATGGGWALDAFDVQVYSYVIPTLMAAWSISGTEAGILGTYDTPDIGARRMDHRRALR